MQSFNARTQFFHQSLIARCQFAAALKVASDMGLRQVQDEIIFADEGQRAEFNRRVAKIMDADK